MRTDLLESITWHLYRKWVYRWKHRGNTLEERREELFRRWELVLEAFADEPVGRELQDAINGLEEVKRVLAAGNERRDSHV